MRTRALTLLALALALAGCTGRTGDTAPRSAGPPSASAPAARGPGTLTVVWTSADPGGGTGYLEGWLPEVTVVDERGGRHVRRGQWGEAAIVFPRLPGGLLRVEAVTRVCGGSCGHLDPPAYPCAAGLRPDTLVVRVDFFVGEPCSARVLT